MAALAVAFGVIVIGAAAALIVFPALNEDDAYPEPDRAVATSVNAIVEVPPKWFRQIVEVSGRATPLGEGYFVLAGSEDAIILQQGTVDPVGSIENGERVRVVGVVASIDRLTSARLTDLVVAQQPEGLTRNATELGDPMISAERIAAAG